MVQGVAPCMQPESENGVVKVAHMGPVSSVNGPWTLRQVLPTELRTHVGGHMQVACDGK